MVLKIGSGDTTKFLSGANTKGFAGLIQKFVSDYPPYYNSFASPIDALRTGAILEKRYLEILGDDYYSQVKATSDEFDCLVSSLDFAKIDGGKIIEFQELKTIFLTEYLDLILPLVDLDNEEQQEFLKKKFKSNYNQIQFQMLCSGLNEAKLVFLAVETYDDEENWARNIKISDFSEFIITRNEDVIKKIKERAVFFQNIKEFVSKK